LVHASSKPPSSCRNWATCSMNCSSFCAVMSVISSRPFHGQLLIAAKRIDNVDMVDGSEVRAMLNQVLQVLDLVQEIGRAHVYTPVTNANHVCHLVLEKKN